MQIERSLKSRAWNELAFIKIPHKKKDAQSFQILLAVLGVVRKSSFVLGKFNCNVMGSIKTADYIKSVVI
jgi:hypothetical protein